MPKRKTPALSNAEQAKRFKEAAKSVDADETGKAFEEAFKKIVKPPKSKPAASRPHRGGKPPSA